MANIYRYGRITRFLEAPSRVALLGHYCQMKNNVQLAHYAITMLRLQTAFKCLSQNKLSNLLEVFMQHSLLGSLIPLCGPIIMVFAQSIQTQNIYTKQKMCLEKNLYGTGSGSYNVPKRSNYSFGKPCVIGFLQGSIQLFLDHTISDHRPRCNILETTIHILRDCPWAKEVWCQSPGSLPLTFFQLPLQSWLQTNATGKAVILHQQLPRKICFPFLCWHLWLAQNKRIFHNQSRSQHRLIYKTVQAAIEFFYLAGPNKPIQSKVSQTIKWTTPAEPFIKLNIDGSSLDNPGIAGAGNLLRDSSRVWISFFALNMGIMTNNMAELGTVRQGLMLAWDLGFKFIQLEIDSMIVLSQLTKENSNFPPDVFPLLCYCRSLMVQAWKVQVHYIYREANACVDALVRRGNHQYQVLTIYDTCPSFVQLCFVRNMVGLGSSSLCARKPNIAIDV